MKYICVGNLLLFTYTLSLLSNFSLSSSFPIKSPLILMSICIYFEKLYTCVKCSLKNTSEIFCSLSLS